MVTIWTLYTPLLCIEIRKGIGDKAQRWQSLVATENALDVLLGTQLSLQFHKEQMAWSTAPEHFVHPHLQNLSHGAGEV